MFKFMGSAYYIVLEHEIEGLDTTMDGKRLAQGIEALDAQAREAGVRPLSEFVSIPPEELAEFLGDANERELPPVQQFPADEGLKTVKALLAKTTGQDPRLTADLRECERILSKASENQVKWHFQIDI